VQGVCEKKDMNMLARSSRKHKKLFPKCGQLIIAVVKQSFADSLCPIQTSRVSAQQHSQRLSPAVRVQPCHQVLINTFSRWDLAKGGAPFSSRENSCDSLSS
jgi:hypothetical protein